MLDWTKKTATIILILPVLMLVLHDVIPHYHHADGIQGVICSNHEVSDCENGDHHGNQLSESHQSCDIETCEACHFFDEFVIDVTYSRLLSILSSGVEYSFQEFPTIKIIPCLKAFSPKRGSLLTFNQRGPPIKFS